MNKYKNKKTIVNGIVFDSKLEARRYTELLLLQKANKIKDLQLQPSFELIPSFKKNGRTFRKTTYKADFLYIDTETGQKIVEDTKRILDRTLQTNAINGIVKNNKDKYTIWRCYIISPL